MPTAFIIGDHKSVDRLGYRYQIKDFKMYVTLFLLKGLHILRAQTKKAVRRSKHIIILSGFLYIRLQFAAVWRKHSSLIRNMRYPIHSNHVECLPLKSVRPFSSVSMKGEVSIALTEASSKTNLLIPFWKTRISYTIWRVLWNQIWVEGVYCVLPTLPSMRIS